MGKFLVITASPNKDGLTAACGAAAAEGLREAGCEVETINLYDYKFSTCYGCGSGWGQCRKESHCVTDAPFNELQDKVLAADGAVFVTAVYWWQPTEIAADFLNKLRRCQALRPGGSGLSDKKFLFVAAAGGSGHGTLSCLHLFEEFAKQNKMEPFDYLPVMKRSRDYMLPAIREAARRMPEWTYGK